MPRPFFGARSGLLALALLALAAVAAATQADRAPEPTPDGHRMAALGQVASSGPARMAALGQVASSGPAQVRSQRRRERDPEERVAEGEPPESGVAEADGATLMLTPSNAVATAGGRVRISLSVLGASPIGRLPVTVRFDPEILDFAGVQLGAAWDGRPRPLLLYDASRPGELVIGLAQLGAGGGAGDGDLLDLEFHARRGGSAELRLERFAVIGSGSKIQAAQARGATVTIR